MTASSVLISLCYIASIASTFRLSHGNQRFYAPEQIHISAGLSPDIMSFNWLTWDYPIETTSHVMIGDAPHPSSLKLLETGDTHLFTDCGYQQTQRVIHEVKVNNLNASTTYYYSVGDPQHGFSDIYSFTTGPDADTLEDSLPHNFIMFGDMGNVNSQACEPATQMVLEGDINAVLHFGDMAYNMYENNGSAGDEFMRDITTMASHAPYMVCMGNHESAYNFSHYTQRFRGQPLPKSSAPQTVWTESGELPNNWYYSFNYGLVHFISISSEIYFDFPWMARDQYEWLIQDLEIANQNRSNAPWIIAYHHRPLYCTGEGDECGAQAFIMRNGYFMNGSWQYSLEDAYYKYGVDFVITGHVHNYERVYDIYREKTNQKTTDMTATTYIVNGDAGNREGHHAFNKSIRQPSWSAFRSTAYSFSKFVVYNKTHIHHQQIVGDTELPDTDQGRIMDDVWFVQNKHGPFEGRKEPFGNADDESKCVEYDPYKEYGIKMKLVDPDPHDGDRMIPYISDRKGDYKGVEGVYF